MKKTRDASAHARTLRRRAERRLREKPSESAASEADMRKLLHELQVHQIELEMVNEELAISEERARQAIEASHAAIWDYDVGTGELYLSESWAAMLGGRREATLTTFQALWPRVPGEERDEAKAALAGAIRAGGSPEFRSVYRIRRPDGGSVWVRSYGKVIERGRNGRALRLIGMNLDITAHMQMEHELRAREARYRAVIETSERGFLAMDRNGRLFDANQTYTQQSGYGREALIGMHISDLEAAESAEETAAHIDRVVAAGHARFESMHRRRDGSLWPVEITASHWTELDQIFVFVADISEHQRMERELVEARKTMAGLQKQQVAAQVAAAIAHEINQPLQAVATYGELSLSMLDVGLANMDKLRTTVEGGAQQARRAGKAITEMLEVLSVGLAEVEAFDLHEEIRRVAALAKQEHGLRFRAVFRLADGLPMVQANRLHLQKVLLNLIQNSVEAMDAAGIASPAVTISAHAKRGKDLAEVTIRDKGPGFQPEDIEHLFQPFITGKSRGIGMGLVISRSLIEANGGELWIDPQEGPGATVHLTLPFAAAD